MLQKYSTNKEKYIQNDYEKTVDIGALLWYYIDKERETENLKEPKGLSTRVQRVQRAQIQLMGIWQYSFRIARIYPNRWWMTGLELTLLSGFEGADIADAAMSEITRHILNVDISYDEWNRFRHFNHNLSKRSWISGYFNIRGANSYKSYRERWRVQWKRKQTLKYHELRLVICKTDNLSPQMKSQLWRLQYFGRSFNRNV